MVKVKITKEDLIALLQHYRLDHGRAEIWAEHEDGTVTVIAGGPHRTIALVEGVTLDDRSEAMMQIARQLRRHRSNWQDYFQDEMDDPDLLALMTKDGTPVEDLYRRAEEDAKWFARASKRLVQDAGPQS